jgi:hypothetical protein
MTTADLESDCRPALSGAAPDAESRRRSEPHPSVELLDRKRHPRSRRRTGALPQPGAGRGVLHPGRHRRNVPGRGRCSGGGFRVPCRTVARYHTPATRPILLVKLLKTRSIPTAPVRVTVAGLFVHHRSVKLRQVEHSGASADASILQKPFLVAAYRIRDHENRPVYRSGGGHVRGACRSAAIFAGPYPVEREDSRRPG